MQDFEKLGQFYLGKIFNSKTEKTTEDLLLYDSKNFTTHAVCVGMTGSGKTGLGIDIIEEAAIDNIPSIVVDPKGDLGNLLLTFPSLSATDFKPWINDSEADQKKVDVDTLAKNTAEMWKEGLAKWGETGERIQKLKDAVDMTIYTPASEAGVPLSILGSFEAPPKEMLVDKNAILERVQSITSSLLGLIGVNADPIKSKEHILLSSIINQFWQDEKNLDLVSLIQNVINPPFKKIGALDLETFYPSKERTNLSISLNGLLASPGFKLWLEGDALDIQKLLYTKEGKPKVAIISIAHLSDSERMFFMTLLLNQLITWMRKQPGTSSLRALFYMDEIFGFFPPISAPPSKLPMLTLLKQARAYGLGIVLCTQNPIDLDYKGLANCGTWFIGKLQTERDKNRVLEGLEAASNGEFDSKTLGSLLSSIGKRIFIMRSIYEKQPVVFETRWTLSYLSGPLTLNQIQTLTKKSEDVSDVKEVEQNKALTSTNTSKPSIPLSVKEYFFNRSNSKIIVYHPTIFGTAKLHFVDSKYQIDIWKEVSFINVDDNGNDWEEYTADVKKWFSNEPLKESSFEELPSDLLQEKNYALFSKQLSSFAYQNQSYDLFKYSDLKLTSNANETEQDFRQRVALALRENRDDQIQKIRAQYQKRIDTLNQKLNVAEDKVTKKKEKTGWQIAEAVISIGGTLLGSLFGKGVTKGTISQAGTALRRAGKVGQNSQDTNRAEENSNELRQQLDEVQTELNNEISKILPLQDPSQLTLDTISIKPRKTDINIEEIAILWKPN
jgi:hypothetical protein